MFPSSSMSMSDEQKEILLELLVQSFPMGLCLVGSEDRLIFANASYIDLFQIDQQRVAEVSVRQAESALIASYTGGSADRFAPQSRVSLKDGRVFQRTSHQIISAAQNLSYLVMWQDISDAELAKTELNDQLALFRKLVDILPDQLFFKDCDHRYTQVNESFITKRGVEDPSVISQLSDRDHLSDESSEYAENEERRLFESGKPIVNHVRQEVWRTGQRVWHQYTKMPIYNSEGNIIGLYGFSQDVTDKKRSEQLIWRQANYDHLTQLPNRRLLADRWRSAWQAHLRDKKAIGLILVDLDGFKLITDTKGHQAGEAVLISVAERLRCCTRGKDTVARLSADEFAILATDIKEEADLNVVIAKVIKQFEEPFIVDREEVVIGVSLGITLAPRDASDIDGMIMHADQALHEAKRAGGRTYRVFSQKLHEVVSNQFTLANDLRYALKNKEFSLNFQPIIDMKTLKAVKVETLLRWHHSTRGWISPVEFIPVAEQTGQIVEIGDWVFREAIKTLARINLELSRQIKISVNVSPRQLQDKSFNPEEWLDYVRAQGFDPTDLIVEITEGLFLDPDARVLKALDTFSRNGVKISLDDFGTGYSSISFLENFEIDVLKLDQAFVRDSELSPKRRILSEAIINMAKALKFEIIAEGIETQDQADWIRGAGCQYGQGYLFSRPLTEDRLEEYLLKS